MSREIKFRARRADNGQWVYGHYFVAPLTDENSGAKPEAGWSFLADGVVRPCIEHVGTNGAVYVIDPDTLGEFTGLRDKHGAEIYEGDVIRFGHPRKSFIALEPADFKAPVVFSYGGFNVGGDSLGEVTDWHECEIVGNKYENGDLLK